MLYVRSTIDTNGRAQTDSNHDECALTLAQKTRCILLVQKKNRLESKKGICRQWHDAYGHRNEPTFSSVFVLNCWPAVAFAYSVIHVNAAFYVSHGMRAQAFRTGLQMSPKQERLPSKVLHRTYFNSDRGSNEHSSNFSTLSPTSTFTLPILRGGSANCDRIAKTRHHTQKNLPQTVQFFFYLSLLLTHFIAVVAFWFTFLFICHLNAEPICSDIEVNCVDCQAISFIGPFNLNSNMRSGQPD